MLQMAQNYDAIKIFSNAKGGPYIIGYNNPEPEVSQRKEITCYYMLLPFSKTNFSHENVYSETSLKSSLLLED